MKTAIILLVSILLSSCQPNYYRDISSDSGENPLAPSSGKRILKQSENIKNNNPRKIQRKILYSANVELTVKKPEETIKQLEIIAKKHSGYLSQTAPWGTTIKVKSDKLDDALNEIYLLGKVKGKYIYSRDVTTQYFDLQIRLDNAEKARKRYLELLDQAENVEAALKVEKELERLNGLIDSIKGQMQNLDHLDDFSVITIEITEKTKLGPLGYIFNGLYQSVAWLFVRN